jgi:hypothetical protein
VGHCECAVPRARSPAGSACPNSSLRSRFLKKLTPASAPASRLGVLALALGNGELRVACVPRPEALAAAAGAGAAPTAACAPLLATLDGLVLGPGDLDGGLPCCVAWLPSPPHDLLLVGARQTDNTESLPHPCPYWSCCRRRRVRKGVSVCNREVMLSHRVSLFLVSRHAVGTIGQLTDAKRPIGSVLLPAPFCFFFWGGGHLGRQGGGEAVSRLALHCRWAAGTAAPCWCGWRRRCRAAPRRASSCCSAAAAAGRCGRWRGCRAAWRRRPPTAPGVTSSRLQASWAGWTFGTRGAFRER